jgi:hypothetical protein
VRPSARLLLRALGAGLAMLGVIFTGRVMLEHDALGQLSWNARLCIVIALACGAYALLSVLLVVVWAIILTTFAPGCIGAREAYALYAITQVMKYIPSNVVHFVGRHVALRRRGVPHLALVATLLCEAAILACGAGLAVAALRADVLTAVYGHPVGIEKTPIIVALVIACCVCAVLIRWHGARAPAPAYTALHRRLGPRLIAALTAAALFFAGTTLLVSLACRWLLEEPAGFDIGAVAATLAGAWLVGFVVPGASAGIGVREAVVILLLSPTLGAGNAAAVAAIYRLVTAGGDALFAGLGELVRRSARQRVVTGWPRSTV